MPLSNTSRTLDPAARDKRTLQRLRREAGYRSAKDFADALGIPASTYSRYERQPESPECAIPLSSAWQIADALGCSIDLVVGRADLDVLMAEQAQDTLDARAARMSRSSREMLDDFLRYLEYRESTQDARAWR